MKIYGQNLLDVLKWLPWQYKVVVAAGCVFILLTVVYIPAQLFGGIAKPPAVAPIRIQAAHQEVSRVLDPSLAYDPATRSAWLAYVTQESVRDRGGDLFRVRLAKASDKSCQSWAQTEGGFEVKPDEILAPDGQTVFRKGAWRVETPTLVHDPDDPGREWKLYAYRYFWARDPNQPLAVAQHYGMIVYKSASDPAREWSPEQWLFSPGIDYPPPPYEQMVRLKLNQLNPELHDVVTYSRPSVLYKDGVLVMTLSAFTEGALPDRIVMVASRDHGHSWSYVGTPLRAADVPAIGPYTTLAGATLVEQEGQVYLAAVLGDAQHKGTGTFIFRFDDVARGLLRRSSATGAPVLVHHIALQGTQPGPLGGGFAAYMDACPTGVLTGEQSASAIHFQIFKTYQKPVEK
ncbi:MAG: hypothetical protein HY052_07975 [Proteobacteria bacterium]|nr:hypothetical protein [Pseudomonadota bacterium]